MTNRAIFLDRDGVINKEVNYLHKIEDFEFNQGIFDFCKHLSSLDFKLIIVTNQSGIARGFYSIKDFKKLNSWMIKKFRSNGIYIHDSFFCPHLPNSICSCRKPKPGMLISAKNKYNISMKDSWMIGDKASDMEAAVSAKISNTIFLRDIHNAEESVTNAKYVINGIAEAKRIISF